MDQQDQNSSAKGLSGSLRKIPTLLLSILRSRLELLSLEIREEKLRLMSLLLWMALAVILGAIALLVVTLTLFILCPEGARPYVLILVSLTYIGLTIWAVMKLRRQLRECPPALESTVEQLKKDVEWIRSKT